MSDYESPFLAQPRENWVAFNELAFAIRDGFPVSPGHTLVVPKRLIAGWFEATVDEQRAIFDLVEEIRASLDEELAPDGYNIGINVGAAAGQTVSHLHVHVIPRFEGDMPDPRGGVRHVIPWKGNYKRARPRSMSTGRTDHFIDHLRPLLAAAESIDIVAAFVQDSGLVLLEERIHSALERGATVRLLCGDYLHLTQERALRRLLDFQEGASAEHAEAEVDGVFEARVLETGAWAPTFHPKAWQFHHQRGGSLFIGSSNISELALTTGVEWNLRVEEHDDPAAFAAGTRAFAEHWEPATPLTSAWIDGYSERVQRRVQDFPPGEFMDAAPPAVPQPHDLQLRALLALRQARAEGRERALAVMATGLGKTWLSAFDVQNYANETGRQPRVLFIAHRAEILRQAANTYRRIFRDARFGWFAGDAATMDADVVFASVQKLSRPDHLERLNLDAFDYVVVDEVHHATADSYRRVLQQLSPGFLLGLTATPERTDGADVLALFDDYLAEEVGIAEGIEAERLAPFHYFGVKDTVDFAPIPWRSGKFDTTALTEAVQTEGRMQRLAEVLEARPGGRTLVFCCSIDHALFVRDWLTDRGHSAGAIVSGGDGDDRQASLDQLADGELQFVCAVDILNEGVDVPNVDRVVLLRPTESSVVFLQQLGRGLRVAEGKAALTVIDFVGNHRIFLERLRWLLSIGVPDDVVSLQGFLDGAPATLPEGCSVELEFEAKELLRDLLPKSSRTAIINIYRELRQARGVRPTVGELFRMGYEPSTLRGKYGSWFGFVHDEGDLDLTSSAFEALTEWFREVETTAMTKCFKMVVLKVLLDADALEHGLDLPTLARRSYELILRSPELFDDIRGVKALGDARAVDDETWLAYWQTNPIAAWTNSDFFTIDAGRLVVSLPATSAAPNLIAAMTRELIDFRLARYRARRRGTFFANVIRNTGDKPILMFGTRSKDSSIPDGEITVSVDDGERWTFRFAKVAVNVAMPDGVSANHLPELLYGWFGPTAGARGTRHRVRFERAGDTWYARPVRVPETTPAEQSVSQMLGGGVYDVAVLRHARTLLAMAQMRENLEPWARGFLSAYPPDVVERVLAQVESVGEQQ